MAKGKFVKAANKAKKKGVVMVERPRESVVEFLDGVKDEQKRADAKELLAILKKTTGEKPRMWGPSIIGFGRYHYIYASGREGDAPMAGFSPRKGNLTLYVIPAYRSDYRSLLQDLGPHSLGVSCLYIKRLADIDIDVLKKIVKKGYRDMKTKIAPGGVFDATKK